MVKEVQRHPLQGFLSHVDLLRISLDEKLEVRFPEFTGDPRSKRRHFQAQMRDQCPRLPADIPEYINVPVEGLGIGDVLTVGISSCRRYGNAGR